MCCGKRDNSQHMPPIKRSINPTKVPIRTPLTGRDLRVCKTCNRLMNLIEGKDFKKFSCPKCGNIINKV